MDERWEAEWMERQVNAGVWIGQSIECVNSMIDSRRYEEVVLGYANVFEHARMLFGRSSGVLVDIDQRCRFGLELMASAGFQWTGI